MTKIPNRAEMAREQAERDTDYREPNALDMPEAPPGITYRWIRYMMRGEDDRKSIMARLAEGWEFVKPEELPAQWRYLPTAEGGKADGVVAVGDLALMKIPTPKAVARQRFYEKKHNDQLNAIKAQMNPDARSRKYMPMYDESRTEGKMYRLGRKAPIED